MKEYVEIVPSIVERMSLLQARLLTGRNLRPGLEPGTDGFLIVRDDTARWLTKEQFEAAPIYAKGAA